MKAKDYIIIGGAVALFLLWKNKNKKVGTSTTTGGASTGGEGALGGGNRTSLGEGMPNGGATTTGGATSGTSQVTVLETPPPSNEPEQVFGVGQPSGMDLPVLTAGTGVLTEVAVQQGGVNTIPEPIYVNPPPLGIEDSLSLAGIKPIVKPFKHNLPVYQTNELPSNFNVLTKPDLIDNIKDPIIIVPKEKPKLYIEQY